MGEVVWLPAEPELPLSAAHAPLVTTLRRALDELSEHYEYVEMRFDDAAWVGSRLAELIPAGLVDKQALLELQDPIERLDAVLGDHQMGVLTHEQKAAMPEREQLAADPVHRLRAELADALDEVRLPQDSDVVER